MTKGDKSTRPGKGVKRCGAQGGNRNTNVKARVLTTSGSRGRRVESFRENMKRQMKHLHRIVGGDIEIRVSVTYNKTTSVSSVGGEVLAGEEVAEFELDGEGGGSPDAEFDALSVLGNVERTLGPNALLELASMSVLLPELGEEDPCGVVTDENEEFNRLMVELFDEEGREMYCS